jgi:hypothetical protein
MQGANVRLGGKDGGLTERGGLLFNYACGNLNTETLWCTVSAAKEIDRPTFERFVESLHYSE